MYKIKVWDNETMIFQGYSKTVPKQGQNFEAWTVTKDNNGAVVKSVYSPARYRITYEDINGN